MEAFVMHLSWRATPTSPTATLCQHGDPECAQQMSGQSARNLDVESFYVACPWPHDVSCRSPSGRLSLTEEPLRHAEKVE